MSEQPYTTPGPWQAEPMTGRGAWIKGTNGNWAALSCGATDLEAEANARLIAAAPEMLEDLIAAERMFRRYGDIHAAKPDASEKAMRNYAMADRLADTIWKAAGDAE